MADRAHPLLNVWVRIVLQLGMTVLATAFHVLIAAWASGHWFPPAGFVSGEPIGAMALVAFNSYIAGRALKETVEGWATREAARG